MWLRGKDISEADVTLVDLHEDTDLDDELDVVSDGSTKYMIDLQTTVDLSPNYGL